MKFRALSAPFITSSSLLTFVAVAVAGAGADVLDNLLWFASYSFCRLAHSAGVSHFPGDTSHDRIVSAIFIKVKKYFLTPPLYHISPLIARDFSFCFLLS